MADRHLGVSKLLSDSSDVVVTYHSVGEPEEYGNVSIERFESDMAAFSSEFETVDLQTLIDTTSENRRLAVTFDDGCRNVATNAVPILRQFDVPATVFVVVGAIDGDPSGLNVREALTTEQLAELVTEPLLTIGNHTRSHPRIPDIADDERLEDEIWGAKNTLEDRFGIDVEQFAFPFGAVDSRSLTVVRSSHDIAVTTSPGHVNHGTDRQLIPRIDASQSLAVTRWELTPLSARIRTGLDRIGVSDGRVSDPA